MPRIVAPEAQALLEDTRRTQILDAAAQVFAQQGYERATITEIARAAGLAEGSLYNYFRSKEDLLIHIPQHFIRRAHALPFGQLKVPDDLAGVERMLLSVTENVVAWWQANAGFMKVFLSALPYLSASAREKYMQLFPLRGGSLLEQWIWDGMRRGVFRQNLRPAIAARAFPGMLSFFVLTQEVLLGRPLTPHDYDEIAAEVVAIFLQGIASRVKP